MTTGANAQKLNKEISKQIEIPKNQEAKKVNDIKNLLDEQLKKYQLLSEKISFRDKFLSTQVKLKLFADNLKTEKQKDIPETGVFYIKLCSKVTYREEETISVNNLFIIEEFLTFINEKISLKITDLEKEIIL